MSISQPLGQHRAVVSESRENPPSSDTAERKQLERAELGFSGWPGEEQIDQAYIHAVGASSSLDEEVEVSVLMAGLAKVVVAQAEACEKRVLSG